MKFDEIEDLLDDFFQKLTSTHLNAKQYSKENLVGLFQKICKEISVDYATYKKFIANLLNILEKNDQTSIVILIDSYFSYYQSLLEVKTLQKIDESVLTGPSSDDIIKKIFAAYRQSITYGQRIRLSEFSFDKSSLTNEDKLSIISFLTTVLQENTKKLEWDNDTVQNILMYLPVLRDLLKEQGNSFSFFILTAMVIDRLSSSEYFQPARDFAEEINCTSYIDGKPYLGFFNSFRCYSNNSSVIPALLYGNLSVISAINSKEPIPEKFVKEIIWQGIKYFRNVSLFPWVREIYHSIPKHIVFSGHEKRSLTHSYFLSLLLVGDPNLPSLALDFLHENREVIFTGGINDATPWLLTLYNMKRIYPDADFSPTGLGHYLSTLEFIVPAELVSEQKAIIQGDLIPLKTLLKNSLVKLNETRSVTDVVHDNEYALKIADRIVGKASEKNDAEAILLAMIVKADYSFVFIEKARQGTSEVKIPNKDQRSFESIYGSESEMFRALTKIGGYSFIWMFTAERRWYFLLISEKGFSTEHLPGWNQELFQELVNSGFFSQFTFDDTIKTKYEVRSVLPEEHVQHSGQLRGRFLFTKITKDIQEPLLAVMDIRLAGFPHNLLLDSSGDFIYHKRPICNILSTEWYLRYANNTTISKEFSKAIWIPTEGGDFTLAQLHSKLESKLSEYKISVTQALNPRNPISSELNIISSHGSDDIALKQVIYPDENPRMNLDTYLGQGKVLILFVCHSGSLKATPFKNSISSIVKQYISKGYSAVIAPFWSLHINIPPIWLPVFIQSLEEGDEIIEAVFKANSEVHKHYPTFAAWLCMHLYGDPHIRVSGKVNGSIMARA